jgi:hypothetical protein
MPQYMPADFSNAMPPPEPISAERIYDLLKRDGRERETYAQLREQGYQPKQALQLAQQHTMAAAQDMLTKRDQAPGADDMEQLPDQADAGAVRAMSLASGATMGFDDEIAGAVAAGKRAITGPDLNDVVTGRTSIGDTYRQARDEQRARKDTARHTAEVSKDARGEWGPNEFTQGEMLGGLATAPLMGAGKGAVGAMVTGGKIGAVMGLGNSNADLTSGDLGEAGQAVVDTGIGGLVGAGAGLLTHGAISGASAGGRYLLDKGAEMVGRRTAAQSAARNAAAKVAEDAAEAASSGVGKGQTVRGASAAGREIERDVTGTLRSTGDMAADDSFQLKASQLTGQRDAALSEKLAQESPQTMNKAQAFVSKSLDYAGRFIDRLVDGVAKNPEKFGTQEMTDDVTGGLTNWLKGLHRSRSAATKPLYDAFERAGGYMPESEFRAGIQNAINEDSPLKTVNEPVTKRLNSIIDEIAERSAQTRARSGVANDDAQLSIQAVNDVRQWLLKVTRNETPLGVEGMSPSQQRRIASIALDGIDNAFDKIAAEAGANPANAQAAEAVALLREANATWKAHTAEIRGAATKTVRRLVRAAGEDDAQGLVERIGTMDRAQIRGVFDALMSADKEAGTTVAQDLRGQIWLKTMEQAGKTPRGAITSQQLGTSELPAFSIMRELERREGALREVFKGDPKALYNFVRVQRLLQRLSFGPNIKGSPTTPLLLAEGERLAQTGLEGMGRVGRTAAWALQMAGKLTGSTQATAEAFSSAEGLEAFAKALEIQLQASSGKPLSAAAAQSLKQLTSRAGLDAYLDARGRESEDPADIPGERQTPAVANEGYGP